MQREKCPDSSGRLNCCCCCCLRAYSWYLFLFCRVRLFSTWLFKCGTRRCYRHKFFKCSQKIKKKKAAQIVSGFGYAISIRQPGDTIPPPCPLPLHCNWSCCLCRCLCLCRRLCPSLCLCLRLMIINFILLFFIACFFSGSCRGVSTAFSDSNRLCNLHDMQRVGGSGLIKLSQSTHTPHCLTALYIAHTQRCNCNNCFASTIVYGAPPAAPQLTPS